MDKSLKFKKFLSGIKNANPMLVESVIEAYNVIYESSEELVEEIKTDLDNLGGIVPLSKQETKPQATDLNTQYLNFKRYGSDKLPMRKSDRSPMVDFIEYELDDKELADALELVLMKSVEGRPSMHKEVVNAFDQFISENMDIEEFGDIVETAYNQLEATPEEEDDYTASLEQPDVIGGVLDPTTGVSEDEFEDEDIANFFKTQT